MPAKVLSDEQLRAIFATTDGDAYADARRVEAAVLAALAERGASDERLRELADRLYAVLDRDGVGPGLMDPIYATLRLAATGAVAAERAAGPTIDEIAGEALNDLRAKLAAAEADAAAVQGAIDELSIGAGVRQITLYYFEPGKMDAPTVIHPDRAEGIFRAVREHMRGMGTFGRRAVEAYYAHDHCPHHLEKMRAERDAANARAERLRAAATDVERAIGAERVGRGELVEPWMRLRAALEDSRG